MPRPHTTHQKALFLVVLPLLICQYAAACEVNGVAELAGASSWSCRDCRRLLAFIPTRCSDVASEHNHTLCS